jgi:adenylate kinase
MKIIILFGPPGSGKGTQSNLLALRFNLHPISTGDLLRSSLSKKSSLAQNISEGNLAPDEVVSSLLKAEINVTRNVGGYIIDGYPRTLSQISFLDDLLSSKGITNPHFLYLSLNKELLMRRLRSRFVCQNCNKTYNSLTSPTKIKGECDVCRSNNFCTRDDDNVEAVMIRLAVYKEQTQKIIEVYGCRNNFKEFCAEQSIDVIHKKICLFLKGDCK